MASATGDSSSTRACSASHQAKNASTIGFDFSCRTSRFFLRGELAIVRSMRKSEPMYTRAILARSGSEASAFHQYLLA